MPLFSIFFQSVIVILKFAVKISDFSFYKKKDYELLLIL